MDEAGGRPEVRWYEIVYAAVLVLLILFAVVTLRPTKVGVIDLDRAMEAVGLVTVVEDQRKEIRDHAADDLKLLRDEYNERRRILSERLGGAQNETERTEVERLIRDADYSLRTQANSIVSESQREQLELLAGYRVRLQPLVREVARRKRIDVVLTRGSHTLYIRAAADLTDALVEAMQEDLSVVRDLSSPQPADAGGSETDDELPADTDP
jgi:Skp family chaperone for outer membrane proteins